MLLQTSLPSPPTPPPSELTSHSLLLQLQSHLLKLPPVSTPHLHLPPLLSSAARLRHLPLGLQLHALSLKFSLSSHLPTLNSLTHFYSSCGSLSSALKVFDTMPQRDVISWTTIINAATVADQPHLSLSLFNSMLDSGDVVPNDATAVSVLRACSDLGALSVGKTVHRIARVNNFSSKPHVVTALVDMYAKCGRIDVAEKLFDKMPVKDVFAWTAMITGLASHGRSEKALELFRQMAEEGLRLDERTVTAALCACRSSGWVAEGYRVYNNMHRFGMRPRIQHYGCMVDLLARAGHLNEAEGFIRRMPIDADDVMWRSLIWAAKFHGDNGRAERLIEERKLCSADSGDCSSYVLSGNVYASAGKWDEKARVRELMVRRRIGKLPGCSRIEVGGVVHEFEAGDSGHPEAKRIYDKWGEVAERLKSEGYRPKVSEVLLHMEDEEKASQLHHHSEKLAVAFGLISTRPGEEILIVKNLRSCDDCHSAIKLVSRIYDRKIVIRDRIRFHHFSNGSCSCGDYW